MNQKNKKSLDRILHDEHTILPKARGNGQLIRRVNVDPNNIITRYSLAYINHNVCQIDHGRVLGYDNAHGYHHKHYMGVTEPVKFFSFEQTEERFQQEFEALYG